MIDQENFNNTVKKFSKIEDARDLLWNKSKNLLLNGYEIEAYILILATWNFAGFRYFLKKFDIKEFEETILNVKPIFENLKKFDLMGADLKDDKIQDDIKFIYSEFKKIVGQTGASKLMALNNPKLYVMWDTEIRKIYRIDNSASPDDYINFLIMMRGKFNNIVWNNKRTPLAKAIDEYNYVLAEKNRNK